MHASCTNMHAALRSRPMLTHIEPGQPSRLHGSTTTKRGRDGHAVGHTEGQGRADRNPSFLLRHGHLTPRPRQHACMCLGRSTWGQAALKQLQHGGVMEGCNRNSGVCRMPLCPPHTPWRVTTSSPADK